MVVYFDSRVCKYCLMQDEWYPLNCCRNFSNRRDDVFAACEQLMPEGDVIYGESFEGIQKENRSACIGVSDICN